MSIRRQLVLLCFMSGLCLLFFFLMQRHLSGPWIQLALNPEYYEVLVEAMQNERKLADFEPHLSDHHRQQFERTQTLLAHLEIMRANRDQITRRYQLSLLTLLGTSLALIIGLSLWQRQRREARLLVLRDQLERLAAGDVDLAIDDPGRDVIGRISMMVQQTSQIMARALKRVQALENLEAWQESLRRMAHEIRTPLTAIRLEVKKLARTAIKQAPSATDTFLVQERSIFEEMAHLNAFTDQYTSFAKIGKPNPKLERLEPFLDEFLELYGEAWSELSLVKEPSQNTPAVAIDRRLIRQVLVNLCNNSAGACIQKGRVSFSLKQDADSVLLRVADNGPGIPTAIRDRVFEPYITTREVGDGMGLGLAICKK